MALQVCYKREIFYIFSIASDYILWNDAPMMRRVYETQGDLTMGGLVWTGKYYTNFPDNIKDIFPMYGPKDMNTIRATIIRIRMEVALPQVPSFLISNSFSNASSLLTFDRIKFEKLSFINLNEWS